LFALKFIYGIIFFLVSILIFSPVIVSFFTNSLNVFNYWLLIPIFLVWILVIFLFSIFWFLVNEFVVPIMYSKKYAFNSAWKYFIKISKNKKMELFMYWLIKIVLTIGMGIVVLILIIPALLIGLLLVLPLLLLTMGIYFGIRSFTPELLVTFIISMWAFMIILVLVYIMSVIFVPMSAFMRIYSLEMVKKLDTKNEN
jgi:hypothetical protein